MEAIREQFEDVFEKHLPEVRRLVRGRITDPNDAADVVQEVFVRAYDAYDSFTPGTNTSAWLYRIAINVCANAAKARKTYRKYVIEEPQEWNEAGHLCDVDHQLDLQYRQQHIRQAMQSLSSDQLLVLTLRFSDGLTLPEIAQVLSIPVDTAKSRLKAALVKLESAYAYASLGIADTGPPPSIKVVPGLDLDQIIVQGERGAKIYHSLGSLYLRKGLIAAALGEWSRAQRAAPDFLDAYLDSAQQYVVLDQPAKAVDTLETAVSRIQSADLHVKLADLYLYKLNDVNEGIQHSTCAVEMEPGNPLAHYTAGKVYFRYARIQEMMSWSAPDQESALEPFWTSLKTSASYLEETLRIKKDFPYASSLLAMVHFHENRIEQAIDEITKEADKADSDDYTLHYAGFMYYKINKMEEAEKYLRRSLACGMDASTLRTLAAVLTATNRDNEAYGILQQAANLAENSYEKAMVLANMASWALGSGDLDLAIEHSEAAIQCNPEHSHSYCNLAEAHLRKGDSPHITINLCKQGLKVHTAHVCFHKLLAEALCRLDKYSEALDEATIAVELEPQIAQRWLLRAKILLKLEQHDEAKQDVMTALDLEPENEEAKARLEEIETAIREQSSTNP